LWGMIVNTKFYDFSIFKRCIHCMDISSLHG
jgi:hypothetical protein